MEVDMIGLWWAGQWHMYVQIATYLQMELRWIMNHPWALTGIDGLSSRLEILHLGDHHIDHINVVALGSRGFLMKLIDD